MLAKADKLIRQPIPKASDQQIAPVRGAKRGGLTDHLSGVHLIPNVGREAMVPGEVVCRRRPAPKAKPAAKPEPKPEPKKGKKARARSPSRRREAGRSRERSKDRRRRSSSSSASRSRRDDTRRRGDDELEKVERRRKEEEQKRREEEQKKLKELEEVRQKQQEMQKSRKQKLGGLFALTEDDIDAEDDDEAKRARLAKEKARAEKKASDRSSLPEPRRAGYDAPVLAVASASIAEDVPGNITAADIDGSMHDHKFGKVWKDWDANKKSDPGEVARQFMKIAAIKRRGYAPGERRGSRSRSRGRR